ARRMPAGGRSRSFPTLVPEVRVWLETLAARGFILPETPFLATRGGTAMKPTFVWRLVKRVAARAGVRPVRCTCGSERATRHERGCHRMVSGENLSTVSPHTLRRTFGSDLLNKGVRLETVARLLGHSSTVVTERAY